MSAKRAGWAILVVAAVVILAAAVWLMRREPAESGPAPRISVAAYAGDESFLPFVAEDRGYFADQGLDVDIQRFEAGKLAADVFLAGKTDLATCSEFVFVSHSFNRPELRIIAEITRSQVNEVVARRDRGIAEPGDLRGKKIGATLKSSGEFFLGTFLTFNGLSRKDVQIVDLTPSEIVEAIAEGSIDATNIWGPNVEAIKERLGDNAISWPGQSGQDLHFLLVGRESWIEANAPLLERLLRALAEAESFVANRPNEAKQIMQRQFGYSETYVERNWSKHEHLLGLSQGLILTMEDQARWRMEQGLAGKDEIPNYLTFLHAESLEAVNPDAVTFAH